MTERRERDAWAIQPRALVLSARNQRTQPPGGEGRPKSILIATHVFMNTARNSSTLMWRRPAGCGAYRTGSVVRTGNPTDLRSAEESRHLKSNSMLNPPKPS